MLRKRETILKLIVTKTYLDHKAPNSGNPLSLPARTKIEDLENPQIIYLGIRIIMEVEERIEDHKHQCQLVLRIIIQ